MVLPVELAESQLEALRQRAKALGISPEQLAVAGIADLVTKTAEDSEPTAALSMSIR